MKNSLKESLLSILCFIIHKQGKGSLEESSFLNSSEKCIYFRMVFDTKCVTCLYAQNEIRRPLIANIFACFNKFMDWKWFL